MTSLILSSMFMLTEPTCELEERTIASLEEQVEQQEDAILLLEEYLLDVYFVVVNPSGLSCGTQSPGPQQDLCECVSEGHGAGNGLSSCLDLKAGGPLGGV